MDEDDIIEAYLDGDIIDPCKYSQFELEKLAEFLGDGTGY